MSGNYCHKKRRKITTKGEIVSLYDEKPKIEESKFRSLQSLKKYMHKDFHIFYDNLHH